MRSRNERHSLCSLARLANSTNVPDKVHLRELLAVLAEVVLRRPAVGEAAPRAPEASYRKRPLAVAALASCTAKRESASRAVRESELGSRRP